MSKPIPKKLRQVKAFPKATIPLWPSSTWIPEKENSIGEKTRSLKLELSTEPGALMGKNITKTFKIFRSGNLEEWILWRRDFNEICVGLDVQTGAGDIRMVRQLLSDKSLKEYERMLATFPLQTQANCNLALNAAALLIFPANPYAKQKKYIRQGLWKWKALTVRNICARISELNTQLASFHASYEKADLSDIISKCTYLLKEEGTVLLKLLLRYEDLFDGTLGTWNGPEIASK
jgi:hypothetical protein